MAEFSIRTSRTLKILIFLQEGEQGRITVEHPRPSAEGQTEERCLSSHGQSGTGLPCHQTYQKWTHSVPSRPVCQHCKEPDDVLLLACKYENLNNPHDDSSDKILFALNELFDGGIVNGRSRIK